MLNDRLKYQGAMMGRFLKILLCLLFIVSCGGGGGGSEDNGSNDDTPTTGNNDLTETNSDIDFNNLQTGNVVTLIAPDPTNSTSISKNLAYSLENCTCNWEISPSYVGTFSNPSSCSTDLVLLVAEEASITVEVDCNERGSGSYGQKIRFDESGIDNTGDSEELEEIEEQTEGSDTGSTETNDTDDTSTVSCDSSLETYTAFYDFYSTSCGNSFEDQVITRFACDGSLSIFQMSITGSDFFSPGLYGFYQGLFGEQHVFEGYYSSSITFLMLFSVAHQFDLNLAQYSIFFYYGERVGQSSICAVTYSYFF